ncbi:unnamed protein product [Peronospora belbahrii]|uniref:Zinc finger PHD-type domain-containing protein n=1 Tax=Peronospora belbahrii TaxID=622444 RepID=A0AAU9L2X4_9STRA|nr:unnamed protein product [Peronospora belbahrii]
MENLQSILEEEETAIAYELTAAYEAVGVSDNEQELNDGDRIQLQELLLNSLHSMHFIVKHCSVMYPCVDSYEVKCCYKGAFFGAHCATIWIDCAPPSGPIVPPSGPIVQTTPRPIMSTATLTGIPQFINPRDYQSESSSEFDTREVNPMDELSDFESETLQQHQDQDQTMDVVMEEGEEGEEEEEEGQAIDDDEKQQNHHIQCPICKRVDREKEGIVCGKCHVACHICCLDPPLAHVSQNTWYCATCKLEPSIGGTGIHVKNVQPAMAHENVTRRFGVNSETIRTRQSVERDDVPAREATSLSIAQVLGGDPNKSNLLLIHACNCDQIECTDDEFRVICLHMKRFLRSVCWASHSDKWRSYRLAQITTELFAYHAMNCKGLRHQTYSFSLLS